MVAFPRTCPLLPGKEQKTMNRAIVEAKRRRTQKKHPNKNKRKRKGGSTLWDVRGSGCGGAALRGVHGGEAAALGPVLLVPVLRHGCAARPPGPGA